MMEGSTFSYTAMVLQGEQPQPPTNPTEDANEDNEDDDLRPVSGPKVLEIFLSPLGHAYSLDICTVIDAYAAD